MAAGVLSVVPKRIGFKYLTYSTSIKRLQQLLLLNGYTSVGTPDGKWGNNTRNAWVEYQESFGYTPQEFVEGGDPENRLFFLLLSANVLFPLPNRTGREGMLAFFESCRALKTPYGWENDGKVYGNGTMMTWGLEMNGSTGYGVCTKVGSQQTANFDLKVPRALNCTAFAQAALSIWHWGQLHNPDYRADQMVGHYTNLSQTRWGYNPLPGTLKPKGSVQPFIGMYTDVGELGDALTPGVLYHIGWCTAAGSIRHDTVMLDYEVYESNSDGPPHVYKTSLAERWERARAANRYAIVSSETGMARQS